MHVIEALGVRDALPQAVRYLLNSGVSEQTRIGEAIVAPGPVTIHYARPKLHVLRNPIRDANPFFHLLEAMWMLAGRDDAYFLDHYIKGFSKAYAKGGIVPDAYGYRWKYGLNFNQLYEIARQLKENSSTRQCVLQMWGAGVKDLLADTIKPCNLTATFRIKDNKLSMTVFNRSNDLIYGCCGANAVHFPIMQEYLAGMIGVQLGEYWQISTNLHIYRSHIDMMFKRIQNKIARLEYYLEDKDPYYSAFQPLVKYPESFDQDIEELMVYIDEVHKDQDGYDGNIANPFLRETVIPMARAHWYFKHNDRKSAFELIEQVAAHDWQQAGKEWLERRYAEK